MSNPSPESNSIRAQKELVASQARSMRRMESNEEYKKGVRNIWHRGRGRIEMLSWEHEDGYIVKQELSFQGRLVEFKRNGGIRTGELDDTTQGADEMSSHLVDLGSKINNVTLELASHLLKHVGERDYYAQHLLQAVHTELARSNFGGVRTAVSSLSSFTKTRAKLHNISDDNAGRKRRAAATTVRTFVTRALALAVLGIAAGLLLGWLFLSK